MTHSKNNDASAEQFYETLMEDALQFWFWAMQSMNYLVPEASCPLNIIRQIYSPDYVIDYKVNILSPMVLVSCCLHLIFTQTSAMFGIAQHVFAWVCVAETKKRSPTKYIFPDCQVRVRMWWQLGKIIRRNLYSLIRLPMELSSLSSPPLTIPFPSVSEVRRQDLFRLHLLRYLHH